MYLTVDDVIIHIIYVEIILQSVSLKNLSLHKMSFRLNFAGIIFTISRRNVLMCYQFEATMIDCLTSYHLLILLDVLPISCTMHSFLIIWRELGYGCTHLLLEKQEIKIVDSLLTRWIKHCFWNSCFLFQFSVVLFLHPLARRVIHWQRARLRSCFKWAWNTHLNWICFLINQ